MENLRRDRTIRNRVKVDVQTSKPGLARMNQTADFLNQRSSMEREPVNKSNASNQPVTTGADAPVMNLKVSTFESAISRMAMAKLAEDSDAESPMSAFSKEKGSVGAFFSYPVTVKSSASSDEPRYIPDALSPRKLPLNSPGRNQQKKEDNDRKSRNSARSDVGVSDVWSMLGGDPSTSCDSRSVVSSSSGASALAKRATKILQRRRNGTKGTPSPKQNAPPKSSNDVGTAPRGRCPRSNSRRVQLAAHPFRFLRLIVLWLESNKKQLLSMKIILRRWCVMLQSSHGERLCRPGQLLEKKRRPRS